jgi:hypothetical protein
MYVVTLGVIAMGAIMFWLASKARVAYLRKLRNAAAAYQAEDIDFDKEESAAASKLVEQQERDLSVFRMRSRYSSFLLATLIYLRVTDLSMKGLYCNDAGDVQVLFVDGKTVCWEGLHLAFAVVVVLVLLVFSIGFPLMVCASLRNKRMSAEIMDHLLQGLKPRFFW